MRVFNLWFRIRVFVRHAGKNPLTYRSLRRNLRRIAGYKYGHISECRWHSLKRPQL